MIPTIPILFIIAISILITSMIEPFEELKIKYKLRPEFHTNVFKHYGLKLITCAKCLSFWLSLVIYYDIYLAVIICVVTELISRNLLAIRI